MFKVSVPDYIYAKYFGGFQLYQKNPPPPPTSSHTHKHHNINWLQGCHSIVEDDYIALESLFWLWPNAAANTGTIHHLVMLYSHCEQAATKPTVLNLQSCISTYHVFSCIFVLNPGFSTVPYPPAWRHCQFCSQCSLRQCIHVFILSSGTEPGGQNKTAVCRLLQSFISGIMVRCVDSNTHKTGQWRQKCSNIH